MSPELEKLAQEEALAMQMAYDSLVDFRKIFLPSPDDCEPA